MSRRRPTPDLPDAALPRRAPARRRAPKADAPGPDAPADAAPTGKPPRPKRTAKPRPKPEPQAPLPLLFGATPRIVIGIDPGATGAAVILRCGTSGPPTLVAAVFWQERQRKSGTVYEPTWWPLPWTAPVSLHMLGDAIAGEARTVSGCALSSLPIFGACERQFSGRFAAAGLGVAWLAGLVAGPITDVISAPLGRPAPAEWRAVAAPHPSQRRKRSATGDVKPCPSALGAQLAGGWPMDLLARFGLPVGSSGADLPVDLGEALGVALWQAARTA